MNDPKQRQAGFNAESRNQWSGFASHRATLSKLLGAGDAPHAGRLCVLGAGNGNDLDLAALLKVYREVHLVDLDAEALDRGAERQGVLDHPALRRFGGVDLTGMLEPIATWTPQTAIGRDDLTALVESPERLVPRALPSPYERVASTCLISQLIGNAFHAVGEAHPSFLALVQAIRLGHLRLLTGLVAHGGSGLLVTDLVSSDTFPGLKELDESALPGLLPELVRTRNFFHGVNPEVLGSVFRQDPVLNQRVRSLEATAPWRWNLHDRVYLVMALRFQASPG